jgi:predicted branched-subunit amino acid permease
MGFALSSFVWGVTFGVAATSKMPPAFATAMSVLVYSGTAQLMTVQLWAHPLPVATILLAVLSINSRYLAMGATLAPLYVGETGKGLIGTALLGDGSWVVTLRAAKEGHDPHSALLTCNALMWIGWIGGTAIGAMVGSFVPQLFLGALGWLVIALLAALLPPLVRSWKTALAAVVAAILAIVMDPWLGGSWHVLIAGLIGAGLAYALDATNRY